MLSCSLMLTLAACVQSDGPLPQAPDATGPRPTISSTAMVAPDTSTISTSRWAPPPVNAGFDYQLGGGYPPPSGVTVVTRDVTDVFPAGVYGICYINAFQNQPGQRGLWPAGLVTDLEDPNFPGEYLIDISTTAKQRTAASFLTAQIDSCATKGFLAVEFDNLDSWTRLDGTPRAAQVPFGINQAVDFAHQLVAIAHDRGLAAGQKNTPQLGAARAYEIGFDFAVSEECARFDECDLYRAVYQDRLIDIEYDLPSFRIACAEIGASVSVVFRDRAVSPPGTPGYEDANC